MLFISSYSYDWQTVPSQLRGYENAISKDAITHYLFMDSRKQDFAEGSLADRAFSSRVLFQWNRFGPYDVVVAGDDAALSFVMSKYDRIFSGSSVVYFGIDSKELSDRAYKTGRMTGQFECHHDEENISLAKRLLPNLRILYVLTDNSVAGLASRSEFEKVAPSSGVNIEYINTSHLSYSEITSILSSLRKPDALLTLNFGEDKNGNYYSGSIASRIAPFLHVPCITPIGGVDELTAGFCVSFFAIGRDAALTVNRLLAGESPHDIEPTVASPSLEFNYEKLKEFGIRIPGDFNKNNLVLHNKPEAFLKRHYAGIFIFLLFVFVFALIMYIFYMMAESKKKELLISALKDAKNAQSDFLSRMSHDMRTPMNAVIGLAGFGLKESISDTARGYFRQIINSSQYLMGLLNDLLDMHKLESGKTVLIEEAVSTKQLFNDILTIVRPRAEAKNLEFETDFSHHRFRYISADKQRLQQVLINVLNNSVKYTSEGGKILWTVEDMPDSPAQERIVVTVKDNGVGMSLEFQKKLFQPFSQEFNVLSRAEGGSGLGLAIAKNIVALMGGNITCQSAKGIGSTFWITIPVKTLYYTDENEESQKQSPVETAMADVESKQPLKGKRILVCDDNEINRLIEVKLLNEWGAETEEADNGDVAVRKVHDLGYDLVLMDVRMPVMDGLEAARQIRVFNKALPIIAVSANAYDEDKKKSVEAGMNAHETKPVNPVSLYRSVASLLDIAT